MDTVAIVGVGLIGGSFALALRQAGFAGRILGVSSPTTLRRAVEFGAIDAGMELAEAVGQADLIYLAPPIRELLGILPALNASVKPSALITDAGSTKQAIVTRAHATITRCQFLGGHPLAGKESRGVENADADLFQGRVYVLTPNSASDLQTPAAANLLQWIERIGARPIVLEAGLHDRTVALTSHLPQLTSTALAALLSREGGETRAVFGPGLLDSTRLALSSWDVWAPVFETNCGEIDQALGRFIALLQELRNQLPNARGYFEESNRYAGQLHNRGSD